MNTQTRLAVVGLIVIAVAASLLAVPWASRSYVEKGAEHSEASSKPGFEPRRSEVADVGTVVARSAQQVPVQEGEGPGPQVSDELCLIPVDLRWIEFDDPFPAPVRVKTYATEGLARLLGLSRVAESESDDLASFARECSAGAGLVLFEASEVDGEDGYSFEIPQWVVEQCPDEEFLIMVAECAGAYGHVALPRLAAQNEFWRQLLLCPTRVLRVKVSGPHGPVERAEVELRGWRGGPSFRTRALTDGAGEVVFGQRGATYSSLRVTKPGHAWLERWIEESDSKIDLSLPQGIELRGVVTDDLGRPVPGLVVLGHFSDELVGGVKAETDAAGQFVLEDVAEESFSGVVVSDPRGAFLTSYVRDTPVEFLRITVPRAGFLKVRLQGGGPRFDFSALRFVLEGLAGTVWETVTQYPGGYLIRSGDSGEESRTVDFYRLGPGRYRLRGVGGFCGTHAPEFEVVAGKTTNATLLLAPQQRIRGSFHEGSRLRNVRVVYPLPEGEVEVRLKLGRSGSFELIPPPEAREAVFRRDSFKDLKIPLLPGLSDVGCLRLERE